LHTEANYIKLVEYIEELKSIENTFTQYQNYMNVILEKAVKIDEQTDFLSKDNL